MVQEIVEMLATAAARLEESAQPYGVTLLNFPCNIQLDYYSCGAKSVYTILKYFGIHCTPESVGHELQTTETAFNYLNLLRNYLRFKPFTDCRGNAAQRNGKSPIELFNVKLAHHNWLKHAVV